MADRPAESGQESAEESHSLEESGPLSGGEWVGRRTRRLFVGPRDRFLPLRPRSGSAKMLVASAKQAILVTALVALFLAPVTCFHTQAALRLPLSGPSGTSGRAVRGVMRSLLLHLIRWHPAYAPYLHRRFVAAFF